MTSTFTNISQNSATATGLSKTSRPFYLLRENGSYLLKEDFGKIILTDTSLTLSNVSQNAVSISNLSKS